MPVFLHVGIVHLLFNILFILVSLIETVVQQAHVQQTQSSSAYGT